MSISHSFQSIASNPDIRCLCCNTNATTYWPATNLDGFHFVSLKMFLVIGLATWKLQHAVWQPLLPLVVYLTKNWRGEVHDWVHPRVRVCKHLQKIIINLPSSSNYHHHHHSPSYSGLMHGCYCFFYVEKMLCWSHARQIPWSLGTSHGLIKGNASSYQGVWFSILEVAAYVDHKNQKLTRGHLI